jgi:hypothetical protein
VSDKERKETSPEDAELEREVRSQRKFSLAEAIGRAAGDLMKGASPVTHKRQAELEIEQYLACHLADADGALLVVLQRQVLESEDLLERSYHRPMEALAGVTERILGAPARLRGFVRRVDAEWGRIYSERPYFELASGSPRPGDPYTHESVRDALAALLEELRGDTET